MNPKIFEIITLNPFLSLRAAQTRAAFSVIGTIIEKEAPQTQPRLKKVEMNPDDEILLTELAINFKDMITYEVSLVILVAEREQANPHGKFRC